MDKAAGVYAAGEMGYTLDCPICKARDINLAAVYQKPRYKRTTRLHVLGWLKTNLFVVTGKKVTFNSLSEVLI